MLEPGSDSIRTDKALASPAYQRATRKIIAKRITEMAQRGERDASELADAAVPLLERSYV